MPGQPRGYSKGWSPQFMSKFCHHHSYFPALQNLPKCLSFGIACICNLHQVIQFTHFSLPVLITYITGCNFSAVKIRFQHPYILRKVSGLFEDDAGLLFELVRVWQESNVHEIEKSSLLLGRPHNANQHSGAQPTPGPKHFKLLH